MLLAAITRIDDASTPMAATYRRARDVAQEMGVPRPSYERVRLHLREVRRARERRKLKRDILLEIALRLRPPEDIYEVLETYGPSKGPD
jgi:hypothetical protein